MPNVHALNLSWLLKLRWGVILGQLVIFFAGDRIVHRAIPVVPMLLIVGVELGTNLGCAAWARRTKTVPEWALAALMALDSLLLAAMIHVIGEDSLPLAVIYLVNIALAGILFQPRWTWALVALSLSCLGALFLARSDAGAERVADSLEWQLREMWIGFGVASGLIVYFVQRTMGMLRERERAVEAARQSAERREKLASLATLAAGAAHELATPLSIIAVAAKELSRALDQGGGPPGAASDARLIREQVERCRSILSQMAADAGAAAGEPVEPVPLSQVIESALTGVDGRERVQLLLEEADGRERLSAPPRAMAHAIKGVIKNALQASPEGAPVSLHVRADGPTWRIEIADRGAGMSPQTLARAGEPFFTTKQPGQGMGLGLFLTRSLLEQLGGHLELSSREGAGTRAALVLPR